jgi:Domain of unknown function (DUF5753)
MPSACSGLTVRNGSGRARRWTFESINPGLGDDEIERRVQLRIARQSLITRVTAPPDLRVVLNESIVRRPVGVLEARCYADRRSTCRAIIPAMPKSRLNIPCARLMLARLARRSGTVTGWAWPRPGRWSAAASRRS